MGRVLVYNNIIIGNNCQMSNICEYLKNLKISNSKALTGNEEMNIITPTTPANFSTVGTGAY